MVAEREGKGSSIAALSLVKRLFIGVKQPNPKHSPCDSNLRLRTPDLSNCNVCDSPININHKKGKDNDKFKTLDSQWRIVIICNSCYISLQSAKNCSYCFSELLSTESNVSCHNCNRRVHRDCLPMYSRLNLCSDLDSFTCIDCWVPRSIYRKRIGGGRSSNCVSKDNSKALEDAAKDAKLKAEKKQADAAKSREKALEKAVAAKRATEIAADALGFDDAELALRLHRAINSSRRTFKNVELDNLVNRKNWKLNGCSNPNKVASKPSMVNKNDLEINGCFLSGHPDPGSQVIPVIEAGIDYVTYESTDKATSEPSVQNGTLDHGSSSDLVTLDHKRKMESGETSGSLMNSERVVDAGHLKMSKREGWILALPAQKEQARCPSMVTVSSDNCIDTERVSRCLHKVVLTYKRGTRFRSSFTLDHSLLQKQSCNGRAMFLRKYSRRRHGGKMYIRKYCRRRTNSKHIDPSTNFCSKIFHLESETSGTVQMDNTEVLTSTGTSFQSPCVPSQASTSTIL